MPLKYERPLQKHRIQKEIGGIAGPGTYPGKDVRPPEGWRGRDYDYEVTNYDELVEAARDEGARIHIAEHIRIPEDHETVWFADGVILEGDFCNPDVQGVGKWIRLPENEDDVYPRKVFGHRGGEPVKMYGVYALGPKLHYFDPDHRTEHFKELTTSFFHEMADPEDGTFAAEGCRFSGWSLAGLEIGSRDHRTDYEIHRCTFNMNPMEHFGYGLELYRGDGWINQCYFNKCRHGFATFGHRDQTVDVTNCVFGPGWWAGHFADTHGDGEMEEEDEHPVASKHTRYRNCTFLGTKDIDGSDQEAIVIRGWSIDDSYVKNCEFAHTDEPEAPGEQGSAIRQESGTDDWERLELSGNTYGEIGQHDGVGAPRVLEDTPPKKPPKKPSEDDEPVMKEPLQTLEITGHGQGGCNYEFTVSGNVKMGPKAEHSNDQIEDNGATSTITGYVNDNWRDSFILDSRAQLESAWFDGAAEVLLDGKPIQLGPLIATEAQRRE